MEQNPDTAEPRKPGRWFQFRLLMPLVVMALLASGCGKPGAKARLRPHASAFHIGMSSSEALAKFPPGYKLSGLLTFYDYGPGEPSDDQLAHEEWFGITKEDGTGGVPLFFNQEKRLVRIGAGFDELRFVNSPPNANNSR